jgi:hypothetical protein
MTDMQRWASPIGEMTEAVNGRYVLASDAEAAIAEAISNTRAEYLALCAKSGAEMYDKGQRDMLAKCIAALETDDLHSEDPSWDGTNWNNAVSECREVLRALEEKPTSQKSGREPNISPVGYDPRAAENRP